MPPLVDLPSPIRGPRWTRPAFVLAGDSLSLCVDAIPDEALVSLRQPGHADLKLTLHPSVAEAGTGHTGGAIHLVASIPVEAESGLYDLSLRMGGVEHRQQRAVRIDTQPPTTVRVAYTSDWHLLQVSSDGSERDCTPRLQALVDRLNTLQLDAVIHLGDLITRYQQPSMSPQPETVIESQMQTACRLLRRLTAPLFLLPGNHDVAFARCRHSWRRHVGQAPDFTDDSIVTLGPAQFVQLDGFVHYDETTYEMGDQSLTLQQLQFLDDMATTRTARWRLIGYHYDYSRQILPRLDEFGIDAFFYGHSKRLESSPFEEAGCADGHLAGSTAYRIVDVTTSALRIADPVAYDDLS